VLEYAKFRARLSQNKLHVVACIPAFNEEKTIASVIVKAMRHVDKIIVCDDGSTDLTREIAEKLGAEVIRHERNMGKGMALRSMLAKAREFNPDIVVMLDADGQHDADEIPRLVKPIEMDEADFVIGSRFIEGAKSDAPLYRRLGLRLINSLSSKTAKTSVKDTQSGFRAFNAQCLKELEEAESSGFGIESEQVVLAAKKGLRMLEVPITIRYKGLEKTSKKSPVFHGGEVIAVILRLFIEEKPLVYLGLPGAVLITLALASGAYLLLLFNSTRYFSVPIAIITLGALFTGMILFITSLILYAITRLARKSSTGVWKAG